MSANTPSDLLAVQSPLNILSKFVSLFRARFSTPNLPWQYSDNAADGNIYIDAEYAEATGYTNQSPAIIVTKGSTVHGRPVVGDLDQNQPHLLNRGGTYSYGSGEIDLRVECVGQTYGESSTLGDLVQTTVSMTLKEIARQFTIRDISPVVLSGIQPHKRDETKYVCYVDFRVMFEHRWFDMESSPVLRGIALHLDTVAQQLSEEVAAIQARPLRTAPSAVTSPDGHVYVPAPPDYTQSYVFLNSPLNMLGKFSEFLKARFTYPGMPWRHSENSADATVFIFPEYNQPIGMSNLSPAINVTRGSTVHSRPVVGDLDQNQPHLLNRGGAYEYGMGDTDIRIECIGQTYGESALLADIVQAAVTMTRHALCKAFTLRDISQVVQSATSPHKRDEQKYVTYVDFRVSFEQRWFATPVAPVLRGAKIQLRHGTDDLNDAIVEIGAGGNTPVEQTTGGSRYGVPPGGTTGQVLAKVSDADYDIAWVDNQATSAASGYTLANGPDYQPSYVYVGYTNPDGAWYVYRRDTTTNERLYATGAVNYAIAWTGRASLVYSAWS